MNADRINETYHGDPAHPTTRRTRERIHWICSQAHGERVLDIGCSQGITCLILAREGFDCIGLDIEPASLDYARADARKESPVVNQHLQFQLGDASALPFDADCFDTVILGEILEHLTHPERALVEARRVLKDGGRLIVTVPLGLHHIHDDHKRVYYPLSLLQLLQPHFQTGSISTLDTYVTYTGVKGPIEEADMAALASESARLAQQLEDYCVSSERERIRLRTSLETATEEVRTLRREVKGQQDEFLEAKRTIEQEGDRLRAALLEKERELEAARMEGTRARRKAVDPLRRKLTALEPELQQARREEARLREAVMERERELRAALVATEQARYEALGPLRELAIKETELRYARTEEMRLRELIAAREREIQQAQAALDQARQGVRTAHERGTEEGRAAARQELASELAQSDAERQALLDRVGKLEGNLREKESEYDGLVASKASELRQMELAYRTGWQEREKRLRSALGVTQQIERVKQMVRLAVPEGSRVAVVSKGDDRLIQLDGRTGLHFPQTGEGVYAGFHPPDSAWAIAHLDSLKAAGAQYLLLPATAFWWLDYYTEFRDHLERNYSTVAYQEEVGLLMSLTASAVKQEHASSRITPSLSAIRESAAKTAQSPTDKPDSSFRTIETAHRGGNGGAVSRIAVPAPDLSIRSSGSRESAGLATALLEIPSLIAQPAPSRRADALSLAVVLDEFTTSCLEPEAHLIAMRPDNWQVTLEQHRPDAVFVESAWRGNEGAWQYRVASYAKNMGDELLQLIGWARERGVPSIFWNKEDPVHYERFIDRGAHFDHVFTSDANCIARYRERLGHKRVYSLPFAAQPDLHNPVMSQARSGSVCFAGTYYGDRHDQRRLDLEHVLKPALAYGLEIFDRRHGMVGRDAANYSFPEIYQPAIRGRLDYADMVRAYKRYRVFLNVNSVKDSPTMFSRRVFELLACGTPVISSHARGLVELLGEGTVFIAESAADTRRYLDQLLDDEEAWARASVKGIRKVLEEHTYGRRLEEVWERVGLANGKQSAPPAFTVVARVRSTEGGRSLAEALARQTYRAFDVVVLTDGVLPETTLAWWRNRLSELSVCNVTIDSNDAYRQCLDASVTDYLAFLDDRDHYGPNYLRDYALAARYSECNFFGKHTFRRRLGANDQAMASAGHSFWRVRSVPSATLVVRKSELSGQMFWGVMRSRVFRKASDEILSIDHFNYLQDVMRSGAGADGAPSPKLLESVEV